MEKLVQSGEDRRGDKGKLQDAECLMSRVNAVVRFDRRIC